MKLVFWHNLISPHQSALTRALATAGHEVIYVASERMSPERAALGWSPPDMAPAKTIVAPSPAQVEALTDIAGGVHIVAGARWTSLGEAATSACIRKGCRLGIMSEAADFRGAKGLGRWIKYSAERLFRGRHFQFVLAMGQAGVRWFTSCGYPAKRLFPFAYFADVPTLPPAHNDPGSFQILYAGRFVPGKGLETTLQALGNLRDLNFHFTLAGNGPLQAALQAQAARCALHERVTFKGSLANSATLRLIAGQDLVVLPSDGKEGWGVLVNEALMLGVPVLCSSRCGARDLIEAPWRGEVFQAGNLTRLEATLRRWILRGKRTPEMSDRIREWAQCITGTSAAAYLPAILENIYSGGPKPAAPWTR